MSLESLRFLNEDVVKGSCPPTWQLLHSLGSSFHETEGALCVSISDESCRHDLSVTQIFKAGKGNKSATYGSEGAAGGIGFR